MSLQQGSNGIHILSISSSTIQAVRMALFKTEVKAISKSRRQFFISRPACAASALPFWERSISIQPVNLPSWLKRLWPCRSKTKMAMDAALLLP